MSRAVIVLGGNIINYDRIKEKLCKDDYFIFCDKGLIHQESLSIKPNLIVGDFDSCPAIKGVEVVKYPCEKDDTDALCGIKEAIQRGFKDYLILGALGRRVDHALANIYLLYYLSTHLLKGKIIDDYSEIEIVSKEKVVVENCYPFFSLLALFGKAEGVNIRGAKYNLENATINPTYQYAISNEILDKEATIWVERGTLLLVKDYVG